jgi:MFS family permease
MQLTAALNFRIYRIAVSAFFFVAGLSFASWASRIPDIKNSLNLSEGALGLILFALPVGQMLSLPVSALLIRRFGSRMMLMSSALLYPLLLVFLALAPSSLMLVFALAMFGFLANLMNISMNTQAVGVERSYGRSIMASFHGLWSVGGFTGALLGGVFVSLEMSPFVHFIIIFALSALIAMVGFKYTLNEDEQPEVKQPLFAKPDSRILMLGLIAFCCMVCEGAMADWSGVYFQKVVDVAPDKTTLGYIAFTSTMAIGRFMGDGLVTRFGVKTILQWSGILIAGGLAMAILLPGILTATLGFLLVGFGVSSVVPIAFGLAGKSKTMSASAALAAVSTISFLGFLIGPPMIGFIAEASSLQFSFAVIAVLGLGTTLFAGKVRTNDS